MDLLLSRYHNIDYVMNLNWTDGIKLINKAIKERDRQKIWDIWISCYPNMTKDNYITFEDFYDKATKKVTVSTKTAEEIYNEALEIRNKVLSKKK